MKTRQSVITEAATSFIAHIPRKPATPTLVDSVLVATAGDLAKPETFVQKTPVPRGTLQTFTASIVDRVLNKGVRLVDVAGILTATELEYVTNVLDEVYAWADAQGHIVSTSERVAS